MTKLFLVKAATPNRILNTPLGKYCFDKNCEAILPESIINTLPGANYRVISEVKNSDIKETAPLVDDMTPPEDDVTKPPVKGVTDDEKSPTSTENVDEESVDSVVVAEAPDGEKSSADSGKGHREKSSK